MSCGKILGESPSNHKCTLLKLELHNFGWKLPQVLITIIIIFCLSRLYSWSLILVEDYLEQVKKKNPKIVVSNNNLVKFSKNIFFINLIYSLNLQKKFKQKDSLLKANYAFMPQKLFIIASLLLPKKQVTKTRFLVNTGLNRIRFEFD